MMNIKRRFLPFVCLCVGIVSPRCVLSTEQIKTSIDGKPIETQSIELNSGVYDPTVPSSAIRERLNAGVFTAPAPTTGLSGPIEKPKQHDIRIKAMVFRDSDNGSVILSIDNRRISLNLHRRDTNAVDTETNVDRSPTTFSIDGDLFTLLEFTTNSITLRNHTTNMVQVIR